MTDGKDNTHDPDAIEARVPDGAVDNDYDDAARDTEDILRENLTNAAGGHPTAPQAGDVAIDLVTRQVVYIDDVLADSIVEYYESTDFDLSSYKTHPWLPVRLDDPVYGVVYVERSVEGIHNPGKIYPTPRGRLARVPVELAEPMRE